jgi:hypothetical protein
VWKWQLRVGASRRTKLKRDEQDWEEWTDEFARKTVRAMNNEVSVRLTDGEFTGGMG